MVHLIRGCFDQLYRDLLRLRDCPDVYGLVIPKLANFISRGHYCLLSPASRTLKVATRHNRLSARMREQLALQVMRNIALCYDQQSDMLPTIDNLANYQQVPVETLTRMLGALEQDGLVRQSNDESAQYLPSRSLSQIKLLDVLRSSRDAEDESQTMQLHSDESVSTIVKAN